MAFQNKNVNLKENRFIFNYSDWNVGMNGDPYQHKNEEYIIRVFSFLSLNRFIQSDMVIQ